MNVYLQTLMQCFPASDVIQLLPRGDAAQDRRPVRVVEVPVDDLRVGAVEQGVLPPLQMELAREALLLLAARGRERVRVRQELDRALG